MADIAVQALTQHLRGLGKIQRWDPHPIQVNGSSQLDVVGLVPDRGNHQERNTAHEYQQAQIGSNIVCQDMAPWHINDNRQAAGIADQPLPQGMDEVPVPLSSASRTGIVDRGNHGQGTDLHNMGGTGQPIENRLGDPAPSGPGFPLQHRTVATQQGGQDPLLYFAL